MQRINIHEAKTHLSKYLEQLIETHEPIIICKSGKPIAQLIEYKKPSKPRIFGLLKGKIEISDDFDELPNEFMEHFE